MCGNCNKRTDEMFCPDCKVLTRPMPAGAPATFDVKKGERFECGVYAGASDVRGIKVGKANRDKYFSKAHDTVVLYLGRRRATYELPNSFWKSSTLIRKAVSPRGRNLLDTWVRRKGLSPPDVAKQVKGKEDVIVLEVVDENEFKVLAHDDLEGLEKPSDIWAGDEDYEKEMAAEGGEE